MTRWVYKMDKLPPASVLLPKNMNKQIIALKLFHWAKTMLIGLEKEKIQVFDMMLNEDSVHVRWSQFFLWDEQKHFLWAKI